MAKYATVITADNYQTQWYFFNAPNRKAAEKYAGEIASVEFDGGEGVIIVVDGITRGKAAAVEDEYGWVERNMKLIARIMVDSLPKFKSVRELNSEQKELHRKLYREMEDWSQQWRKLYPFRKGVKFFGRWDEFGICLSNAEWYR